MIDLQILEEVLADVLLEEGIVEEIKVIDLDVVVEVVVALFL